MDRIATRKAYHSEIREEHAEITRTRILDAALRVLARGLATMSIPAVAAEARVSVPTVYRHFGTMADLLSAVYPHAVHRAGLDTVGDPRSVDELRPLIRAIADRIDALDDLTRAAMASPVASEVRHATMPMRYERIARVADSIEPKVSARDRDRITRLLVVLTASASLRMWRDHLGLSVDEVADDVDWIMRAVIAAAGGRKKP
jgi:AcrR family transcriptional regulator